MFCTITFVFVLIGSLDGTWGRYLSDGKVTDEELAKQWLLELDQTMVRVFGEYQFAWWNYEVNKTKENEQIADEADLHVADFSKESCENASRFDWQNFTDPSVVRQFRNILSDCFLLTDNETKTLFGLMGNMSTIYHRAKICSNRSSTSAAESQNATCISKSSGLARIMATSRDWEELLWAWEGWRNVTGRKVKSSFIEIVKFRNKDAKQQGYRDYGDYRRKYVFEKEDFSSICEQLWQQIKPLYQHLHAYVRRKLMQSYPQNIRNFPNTRHIPAHLTGDIWAQSWGNILDLVKPFPNSSVVNLTKLLTDKGFDALRMFRQADSFFISLGLPPMSAEFWNNSVIEKPKDGRKFDCYASAWDFHNRRDFRIKQCTEITGDFFIATHRRMINIQYFLSYKHQLTTFKYGPNGGFQEAVGDLFELYASTPEHLRKINLLNDTTDSNESDINFLMQQALEKVAFLPFNYLFDLWRWGVFNGTITPDNYNRNYWKLRCALQGISPPKQRSEDDFDIGSNEKVSDATPFISYFVSGIIQFHFHKCLCREAGHVGPLHKCDIYHSHKAGLKLRRMMSLGNSKPWPEAMEIITGQRNMDAGPLLDYFRPLQDWLEKENRGHDVTWDEECPSGSFQ